MKPKKLSDSYKAKFNVKKYSAIYNYNNNKKVFKNTIDAFFKKGKTSKIITTNNKSPVPVILYKKLKKISGNLKSIFLEPMSISYFKEPQVKQVKFVPKKMKSKLKPKTKKVKFALEPEPEPKFEVPISDKF